MTVCALPRSDLQTTPTFDAGGGRFDGGAQARAARPDHQDVVGVRLVFRHLENSPVGPDAHRAEADVDIGETDGKQTRPRPLLVACRSGSSRSRRACAGRDARRCWSNVAADQVPERVTSEDVPAEQHDIDGQNERSDADAEAVLKPERLQRVVDQKAPDHVGEPQEVAVEILQNRAESFARRDKTCAARPRRTPEDRPRTTCNRRRGSSSR